MLKSKRFLAMCIAVILFTTMVYTTEYTPLEIATSISIVLGLYLGAETVRRSNN
jgi:hypothetical protein